MAVLYIYEIPDASIAVYDRVRAQVDEEGNPEGAISHVACKREGGGLLVVEVWESEELHDEFNTEVRERIKQAGGPANARSEARKLPVYNMVFGEETAGIY